MRDEEDQEARSAVSLRFLNIMLPSGQKSRLQDGKIYGLPMWSKLASLFGVVSYFRPAYRTK